jgi:cytokinin dehydrogenase
MDANRRVQTDDLPPPLDGEISFDEAAREATAADFGHVVHNIPECVLLPGSEDDIVATISWAGRRGRRFAAQGQRHSVWGRSMARDGIVGDMSRLNTVRSVEGDRVVVEAGATWSEVLGATLPRGLTPPVLAEYLELSVGGTLVVGGVGATTSRFGLQSDNVIEMDVVTGHGEKLTCSPSSHSDLFDAVRAGLGQVAVITTATLELIAAPEQVRRFLLFYPDLATMLGDARLLAGDDRFDGVQGAILPAPSGDWVFRLDAAKYFTGNPPDDGKLLAGLSDDPSQRQPTALPYFGYLNRLAALETALRANGQWFFTHPWLMSFIGDSQVESVVNTELKNLTPEDLGQFGQIVLSPIRRRSISSPLLRLPPDSLVYAFNFVRVPATDGNSEVDRLIAANGASYRRILAAAGTLYPVSAFPLSGDEWRQHFGSAFDQLNAAKQRYDPDRVLTPGYEIF